MTLGLQPYVGLKNEEEIILNMKNNNHLIVTEGIPSDM
jgi:hypothetical protein